MSTVTAAGGFAFFLIFYELYDNRRNNKGKHKANYYGGYVFCNPSKHIANSFHMVSYFTSAVNLVASL